MFEGTHSGYLRLPSPVSPVRTLVLDHERHSLTITDYIAGAGVHIVTIPLHLAPGVEARSERNGELVLTADGKEFLLRWSPTQEWELTVGQGRVSPSYGVVVPVVRVLWRRGAPLPATLNISLWPREIQRSLADQAAFTTAAVLATHG